MRTSTGMDSSSKARFHSRNTERDHLQVAAPRSLIFDTPSIFSHGHVATSSVDEASQTGEKALAETMHDEDSEKEAESRYRRESK